MTDPTDDGAAPAVRTATPADERRLRAIQAAALAEPWPALLSTGVDGPPLVLVVETDRVVGYALAVPGDGVGYLAELAVAPDAQGRGLGTRLVTELLDRLADRGLGEVRLTVRRSDERARSFYDRFGFEVLERLPDHYEDGDGLLLARDVRDGATPSEDGEEETWNGDGSGDARG